MRAMVLRSRDEGWGGANQRGSGAGEWMMSGGVRGLQNGADSFTAVRDRPL
jgi:hypothetical protein